MVLNRDLICICVWWCVQDRESTASERQQSPTRLQYFLAVGFGDSHMVPLSLGHPLYRVEIASKQSGDVIKECPGQCPHT